MVLSFYLSTTLDSSESICDQMGGTARSDFLTINCNKRCVVWYSAGGNRVVRHFSFHKVPQAAIFCQFQNPSDVSASTSSKNAVAVLVSPVELCINMFTGEVYSIKMPYPMKRILAIPLGLLFQAQLSNPRNALFDGLDEQESLYFTLSNPSSPLQALKLNGNLAAESFLDSEIQCINGSNLCAYSESQNTLLMWQIQESIASLPGLHDLSIASQGGRQSSRKALDSALDILDGSVSQYASIMPSKSDAMSMLLLSDSFQAGGNESYRPDRFIDSSSSMSIFNTSNFSGGRRSLGGERALNDLHQASALTREGSTSPVHMILEKPFMDGTPSGGGGGGDGAIGASFTHTPLGKGQSAGQPYGPILKETSTQPYHLNTSPGSLMTGSAFQRSLHSTQMDDSSVPMNISRSNATRSQAMHQSNTTMPLESSMLEVKTNEECELRLVQSIPLPEGTSSDIQCSFSGSSLQSGGLLFHCLDRQSGRYLVYGVQSSESDVAYTLLRSAEGFASMSHVTLPLEETQKCLFTEQRELTVDSAETHFPITLLLKKGSPAEVSIVMGSTPAGEVPLRWENDFLDEVCEEEVHSITVLQQSGTQILISTASGIHIVSLQNSLFGSHLGGAGVLVNAEADLTKALVAHYGAFAHGIVEYAVGLLMAGVDSRQKFLALLSAACGVPVQILAEGMDQNSDTNFSILVHCYNSLSDRLAEEGRNRLDVIQLCHTLLQEYSLRFDQLPSSGIRLRESFLQLVALLEKHNLVQLLGPFYDFYCCTGRALSDPAVDGRLWFKQSLSLLNARSTEFSEFPLPSTVSVFSFHPYPTLRLTSHFFKRLLSDVTPSDSMQQSAINIVNAFVSSVLQPFVASGKTTAELDWLGLLSFMPGLLRTMIQLSLEQCAESPCRHWPNFILREIGRNDLCVGGNEILLTGKSVKDSATALKTISVREDAVSLSDGLHEVENASRLRFTEDERMHEVCRMLRSSTSVYLKLEKAPEVSDFDHKAKLQQKLLSLCRRTLACPVGRGMLTMSSLEPLIAEALPIPALALSGRVAPTKLIMDLETTLAPPDLTLWPEFHNGVAAALRVGPITRDDGKSSSAGSAKVTRNWILYNRTASQAKAGGESSHAGFLFGLGLHGHLSVLSVTDICDYLVQGHEPTTIAILLGSTASKVGSADPLLSKTLSLHLPALLPAQHWDIEISPLVQTAALVGMGLLHCSTGHRVMTEFLLAELSRKPTSDRCESREAMVLASCWSLGMVLLGKGNEKSFYNPKARSKMPLKGAGKLGGLSDLRVEERLLLHIDGGKKPAESSLFPSHASLVDVSSKSSRVLEGDDINVDVTAPGACIALALIYLRSNNSEILNRLSLPETLVQLDSIRPDLLIFKAVARTLIMWDAVEPTEDWIHAQIPAVVMKSLFTTEKTSQEQSKAKVQALFEMYNKSHRHSNRQLEGRTAFSLYLCTVSGFCWGLGLVYAGSLDERAKKTILDKLLLLQSFRDHKPLIKVPFILDKSQRFTLEMCIGIVSLSLSCVMAGSGDLECLRLLRELRFKVEDTNYGTHLALAMAIGLLFLAGGNSSLRRDPLSTACLLLAMCPRFPARTVDHQYHLQPLRHLYVLATEDRALHTIDVDTGKPVALNVEVELLDGSKCVMRAPGLLPELQSVRRVSVTVQSQLQPLQQSLQLNEGAVTEKSELYYPTALEFNDDNDTTPAAEKKNIFSLDRSFYRNMHSRRTVPVLLVKKVPSANGRETSVYSTQHIAAPDEVRILLQRTLEPVHFKKVQEQLHFVVTNSSLTYHVNRCVLEDLLIYLKEASGREEGLGEIIIRCKPFLDVLAKTLSY